MHISRFISFLSSVSWVFDDDALEWCHRTSKHYSTEGGFLVNSRALMGCTEPPPSPQLRRRSTPSVSLAERSLSTMQFMLTCGIPMAHNTEGSRWGIEHWWSKWFRADARLCGGWGVRGWWSASHGVPRRVGHEWRTSTSTSTSTSTCMQAFYYVYYFN